MTCAQLHARCSAFFEQMNIEHFESVTPAVMMNYCNWLNRSKKSQKTCKEYYAAIGQFIRWSGVMGYINENPLEQVKPKFKKSKSSDAGVRQRWQEEEIGRLFAHPNFKRTQPKVKWVTALQLYQGLRPNEACQLASKDVVVEDGVHCLRITDEGTNQHVKNEQSIRLVPLH